ncbi:hypothetical protein ACHAP8_007122 [Fusarium lateritium]
MDDDVPKTLTHVNTKDISQVDITILEKGRRGKVDAVVSCINQSAITSLTTILTFCSVMKVNIRRISGLYVNLLQLFKRIDLFWSLVLQLFTWDRFLFVNDTPFSSSRKDLLGPLTLISYAIKSINALETLIFFNVGYTPGLYYHSDYDPFEEENEVVSATGEDLETTKGIFSDGFISSIESEASLSQTIETLLRASAQVVIRPWLLSLELVQDCSRELSWGVNLGCEATSPVPLH